MKEDKGETMDSKEILEKLIKKEISVTDLSSQEVKLAISDAKKMLKEKTKELEEINEEIKDLKKKIDNWEN